MASPYDQLEQQQDRSAAFAQSFVGGTRNPEQYRRFSAELKGAQERERARREADFEALQLRDPKVGNLIVARQREERLGKAQQFQQSLAQEKLALDDERLSLSLRNEQRAIAKTRLDMMKEELDLDRELLSEEHTVAAEQEELELRQQFPPGSEGYKRGIMNIALRYHGLKKDYRQTMLGSAGYIDPDAAWKAATDAAEIPGSRVTGIPLPGGAKATITGPPKPRELATVQKELDAARKMWGVAKKDAEPSNIEYAEARVRQLEEEAKNLGGVAGPQPSGGTTTSPAPAAQKKTVWRADSQGNRFEYDPDTKQPTGKYIPAK